MSSSSVCYPRLEEDEVDLSDAASVRLVGGGVDGPIGWLLARRVLGLLVAWQHSSRTLKWTVSRDFVTHF